MTYPMHIVDQTIIYTLGATAFLVAIYLNILLLKAIVQELKGKNPK